MVSVQTTIWFQDFTLHQEDSKMTSLSGPQGKLKDAQLQFTILVQLITLTCKENGTQGI
jgi:hypothetical protein